MRRRGRKPSSGSLRVISLRLRGPAGAPPIVEQTQTRQEEFPRGLTVRAVVVIGALIFYFVVLWLRVGYLQTVKRPYYEQFAEDNLRGRTPPPGQPGSILDCHDRPLAVSVRVFDIKVAPARFRKKLTGSRRDKVIKELAQVLGVSEDQIRAKVNSSKGYEYLVQRLPAEKKVELDRLVAREHLSCITSDQVYIRKYPLGKTAAYLLGWRGSDHAARCGLEQVYDFVLSGQPGSREAIVDRFSRAEFCSTGKERVPPLPGRSLVLTLDADLQQQTELALERMMKKHRPRYCAAVVMDPRTGEVKAMAALPGYDPNKFSTAPPGNNRPKITNPPLSDPVCNKGFEPGSVMKVFTVASALERGLTKPTEHFRCKGRIDDVGGFPLYCADGEAHGLLDLTGVIAHSCNISAARLAMRIGGQNLVSDLRRFGFGHPTRVGLRPEGFGLLPPPPGRKRLYVRDVANLGFGQGMSCTLIQLAAAYCGLVNDGVYMLPHVVKAVINQDGSVFDAVEPQKRARVCGVETSRLIRSMLKAVVDEGTGKQARIKGVEVGGKTGTAQKPKPGGGYWADRYTAAFVLVVPLDAPRYVIAVVADDPRGGHHHGGDVAAPTAREIALAALRLGGSLPAVAETQLAAQSE